MILVFKEFLQSSIPPLIYVLYAKGYHDFPLKNFRLTVRKISSRKPSVSQKISGIEKLYASEGNITIFYKKYCCLTVPKILRRGTLLCFRNFLVSKKLMDKRGGGGKGGGSITIFSRRFLVSQCQNISRASLQNFRKFGVSKNFMHNSITIFRWKYFVSRCGKIS